ncbi:MAG: hypothetical protein KatS3mg111_3711 [Pirellulaceae bacterium]|nr:MAG: hypothetical protein KatS3mg111_3711 [Pirellulaceae bacterium]
MENDRPLIPTGSGAARRSLPIPIPAGHGRAEGTTSRHAGARTPGPHGDVHYQRQGPANR